MLKSIFSINDNELLHHEMKQCLIEKDSYTHFLPFLIQKVKEKMMMIKVTRCLIIKYVLLFRQIAHDRIASFYKKTIMKKRMLNDNLIKSILLQRKVAIERIQHYYHQRFIKKLHHSLYKKVKDCYSIAPSIGNNESSLQMRIYLNPCKLVQIDYCPLRKSFVVDIPKYKVTKTRKLKVNFIINNQIIIDPSFTTECDNGQYVNIIDFDLMEAKEIESQSSPSSFFVRRRWSVNESKSTSDDDYFNLGNEDEYSNIRTKEPHMIIIDKKKERIFQSFNRNSIDFSTTFPNGGFEKKLFKPRKRMTITSEMSILKSILKPSPKMSSSGRCINTKKPDSLLNDNSFSDSSSVVEYLDLCPKKNDCGLLFTPADVKTFEEWNMAKNPSNYLVGTDLFSMYNGINVSSRKNSRKLSEEVVQMFE